MGIIKCAGFVPGYGYVTDIVRNMKAMPMVKEKETEVGEKVATTDVKEETRSR